MTEIANHIFGDTLTENPAVAQSAFGPHRVIPDRWKGMSPQQLEAIRKEQEKQRLEKQVCDKHYHKKQFLIMIGKLSKLFSLILHIKFKNKHVYFTLK